MIDQHHTRRAFLAGLSATMAAPAVAAPVVSVRPPARPRDLGRQSVVEVEQLFNAANLSGVLAYAVADARTGVLLEMRSHLRGMPPASTAKAITAQYALNHLGPGHRFRTRLVSTGPIRNGQLQGDLVLFAGGDPTLTTEALGDMAAGLKAAGVAAIGGRFLVVRGDMPFTSSIDPGQPDHVGYNPAVAGLSLNFNRVHFEWKRASEGYSTTLEARTQRFQPSVQTSSMEIIARQSPIYEYRQVDGIDRWSVAQRALGNEGSRWLPVRNPLAYAADVFRTLARTEGVGLPRYQIVRTLPASAAQITLYEHVSNDLQSILQDMLKFSTNLTAEMVGQSATLARGARPANLAGSAYEMSEWLRQYSKARRPAFIDHSGLGESSDITAHDMVAGLNSVGAYSKLRQLMKPWYFRTDDGGIDRNNPVIMSAKTGTLNYVSALAGYILPPDGRALSFAIFTADEETRASIPRENRERPPGARSWARRSRSLQDKLLKRWTSVLTG
ncbi:MAG: D-alanyl-D-alanine carboxypeptidase/D-alanyl-D-alanine-endopeptidase [Pseudomonadota bacterium]